MKRWKDACDGCFTYRYDCHSYIKDGVTLILCPSCASKMGLLKQEVMDWSGASYLSDKDCQVMQSKGWKKIEADKEKPSVSVDNYSEVRLYYNGKKTERTYFLLVR